MSIDINLRLAICWISDGRLANSNYYFIHRFIFQQFQKECIKRNVGIKNQVRFPSQMVFLRPQSNERRLRVRGGLEKG